MPADLSLSQEFCAGSFRACLQWILLLHAVQKTLVATSVCVSVCLSVYTIGATRHLFIYCMAHSQPISVKKKKGTLGKMPNIDYKI